METLLIVCGGIITVGGAVAAIYTWIVKPLNHLIQQTNKISKVEEGQKEMGKALSQLMEHTISGNNIEELEKSYKRLIEFYIDN